MDKRDVLREVQRRVLDNDARRRRLRKTLEILEQDNHVEDCQSDAKTTKRPKFEDDAPGQSKRRRRTTIGRAKFKKTFELLLDEEYQATKGGQVGASYFTATVPDSRLPPRKFCSVCGFLGAYVCVVCGSRYCSIKCRDVHNDTRCLNECTLTLADEYIKRQTNENIRDIFKETTEKDWKMAH
ncbi:Zinc finger HIT domain-containing protein 1 [Taenia solium]|eukprot:TsM_000568800 transcript=TsM_000568800 gene=TsM_000568800